MPDYRKILFEYMRGVVRNEGVSFIDRARSDKLTPDEMNALYEVEGDLKADPAMRRSWI